MPDQRLIDAILRSERYPDYKHPYDALLGQFQRALGREETIKDLIVSWKLGRNMDDILGAIVAVYETEREQAEERLRSALQDEHGRPLSESTPLQ